MPWRGGVDTSMDDSAPAVDETKMNVTMMEDEPEVMAEDMPMASAPSMVLSGEAKMGLKRVDDNASTKPEDDDIKTVVEYEITFKSSGVTDGGLVFGAAISIDEDGKGAAGSNGVNAASVHIGGADDTWKLQFGSNDPGIDLVPAVGLADADEISGMTKTVLPLMYTDGTTMKRARMVDTLNIAAIKGAGTLGKAEAKAEITGDPLSLPIFASDGSFTTADSITAESWLPLSYIKQKEGGIKYPVSKRNGTAWEVKTTGDDMPAPPPSRSAVALTGTVDSFSYALTAGEGGSDAWSVGVEYDPGAFYVSAGADSNDVLAVGAGGTFAGNTLKATYVKQDGEMYHALTLVIYDPLPSANPVSASLAKDNTVNEMEAWGLSLSREIGQGSSVTATYSQLADKGSKDKVTKTPFIGTKQWELDFTYDLGSGASFYAGIEQANKSTYNGMNNMEVKSAGRKRVLFTPVVKKSKVTTLEAGITMTF